MSSRWIQLLVCCFALFWFCGVSQCAAATNFHSLYLQQQSLDGGVISVVRDDTGYLWIGTDNGLRRYDGYQLKTYDFSPSLSAHSGDLVTQLMIDSRKNLWVGGLKLSVMDHQTEQFTEFDFGFNAEVWALFEDVHGRIWFGGEGFGLGILDPDSGEILHHLFNDGEMSHATKMVRSIVQDSDPNLVWVGTGGGLARVSIDTYAVEFFELPIDTSSNVDSIRGIEVDEKGQVWLATRYGIVQLNPDTKHIQWFHQKNSSLQSDSFWSVAIDSEQSIWFGTDKDGIYQYRPDRADFVHFNAVARDESRLPASAIYEISEDQQGTLWIAAGTGGLRRLSLRNEKFYVMKHQPGVVNSLGFDNVLDMLESSDGFIYIATDGGGLDRYDPNTGEFLHYRHDHDDPHSLAGNSVIALAEDAKGNIWASHWGAGISILDPQTQTFSRIQRDNNAAENKQLANNNIFKIQMMSDGRVMLSVWQRGLQIYDPKTEEFESYFADQSQGGSGIINTNISDIEKYRDGRYWIGGNNGIELFDPQLKKFHPVIVEGVDRVNDFDLDEKGILWVASAAGLMKYDPVKLEYQLFTVADGLSDNFVASMERDFDGNMWLGTRAGISRFVRQSGQFDRFDEGDGIPSTQFNRISDLITRDGIMYFGTNEGIVTFSPSNLPVNQTIPRVVLTGIELFQKPIDASNSPLITQPIQYVDRIELGYDQRDISFQFASLNLIFPQKNLYKYRLSGLENDWIEVDGLRRLVRYTNLDPGEYVFEVRGSNNDGIWNTQGLQIELVILSPWWLEWWAKTLFAISFFVVLFSLFYWQRNRNIQRRLELESLVSLKTAELEQANQNISQLNLELEGRVAKRTAELSIEIEERRLVEQQLFHLAFHDNLTGLPNRSWLLKHLDKLISQCTGDSELHFSLMFLDGDRFKQINDTHGHLLGDQVLEAAAKRLEEVIDEGFRAVRLGGDEFTVVSESPTSAEQVIRLGNALCSAFEQPIFVGKIQVLFRMSIGIVLFDHEYTKPEQILRDADIAMYKAKEQGRGSAQLFDQTMREKALETIELEHDLSRAIAQNELSLVFQPIHDIQRNLLSGFEALLRWHHPQKGFVSPDRFIPVAEESGLIVDIGHWVLNRACQQLRTWLDDERVTQEVTIAVNLSTLQLAHQSLVTAVQQALDKNAIPPHLIKLEITESALMENPDQGLRVIEQLTEMGVHFAIDDFGTGYSSLGYLDKLPVQFLKIDRMFVQAMQDSGVSQDSSSEIVRATISLAHNLNIQVVAEGLETAWQTQTLTEFSCDYGQGYYFSKPLSPQGALAYILDPSSPLDDKLVPNTHTPRAVRD